MYSDSIVDAVRNGAGDDDEVLEWCHAHNRKSLDHVLASALIGTLVKGGLLLYGDDGRLKVGVEKPVFPGSSTKSVQNGQEVTVWNNVGKFADVIEIVRKLPVGGKYKREFAIEVDVQKYKRDLIPALGRHSLTKLGQWVVTAENGVVIVEKIGEWEKTKPEKKPTMNESTTIKQRVTETEVTTNKRSVEDIIDDEPQHPAIARSTQSVRSPAVAQPPIEVKAVIEESKPNNPTLQISGNSHTETERRLTDSILDLYGPYSEEADDADELCEKITDLSYQLAAEREGCDRAREIISAWEGKIQKLDVEKEIAVLCSRIRLLEFHLADLAVRERNCKGDPWRAEKIEELLPQADRDRLANRRKNKEAGDTA